MMPRKLLSFHNGTAAGELTLFAAISGESRRAATLSGDVVAGCALSAAAALPATLPIHAWQAC